jgi:hypothetical protein
VFTAVLARAVSAAGAAGAVVGRTLAGQLRE